MLVGIVINFFFNTTQKWLNVISSDYGIKITVDTLMITEGNMNIAGSFFQLKL